MGMIADQAMARAMDILQAEGKESPPRVVTDTTEFFDIKRGDVLAVDGQSYLIRGHAREGRFGLDDEIKPWVKTALDLATGEKKIIKLVFYEFLGRDKVEKLIWNQREAYLQVLRQLNELRVETDPHQDPFTALLLEGGALHLEADLKWLDRCEELLS